MREGVEHPLLRSIRDFRAALGSVYWIGATPIAEISWLRVLIGKYPEPARRFLDEVARDRAAGRPADQSP
jgi:hypothetical protein